MFRSATIYYTSRTPAKTVYDVKNLLRRKGIKFEDVFYKDNDEIMDTTLLTKKRNALLAVEDPSTVPSTLEDMQAVTLPFSNILAEFNPYNDSPPIYRHSKERIIEFINSLTD